MKYLAIPLLLAACASHPAPAQPTRTFACNGGIPIVGVSYPNARTAVVSLQTEGSRTTYTLHRTAAANGTRYSTSRSANPVPGHFIWTETSANAILFTTAKSATQPTYVYEKQLAVCRQITGPTLAAQ